MTVRIELRRTRPASRRTTTVLLAAAVSTVVALGGTTVATADVFSSPATGTHTVQGAILDTYRAQGGPAGLGLPLTDELRTPDGFGRFSVFQNGSIYWTPWTGAHSVRGSIRDTWAGHGWEPGQLGYPISSELRTPDGQGYFTSFQRGGIYVSRYTGTHAVYGAIYQRWSALGWEAGPLGYPTSNETSTRDGRGRYNSFSRNAVIYWTPTTGAHAVWGAIAQTYDVFGLEAGPLGYPTTSELPTPNRTGRYNHFERGSIYWSPQTGAHKVDGPIRDQWAAMGWENSPLGFPIGSAFPQIHDGQEQQFEGGSIAWYPGGEGSPYQGVYVSLNR